MTSENKALFSINQGSETSFSEPTFRTKGAAGNNSDRLARILAAYDITMNCLKMPHTLSEIVTAYQASVDAKYHNDFVKIATLHHAIDMLRRSRAATAFQPTITNGTLNNTGNEP